MSEYSAIITVKSLAGPPDWEDKIHIIVVKKMVEAFGENVTIEQLDEWGIPARA